MQAPRFEGIGSFVYCCAGNENWKPSYVQFRKEKEYAKVLKDDARLLSLLREGVDENEIFSMEIDELLVLRDLLVNRFGTGKIAS